MTSYTLDIWGSTDVGQVRDNNEDAIFFSTQDEHEIPQELIEENGHLLAVADGVGGVWGGEEASTLLLRALVDYFYQERELPIPDHLVASIEKANQTARDQITYRDSSTTLVVAVVQGRHLHVAHVGDSRAYLIRDRTLQQLTEDHSFGSRLLRYLVSTDLVEVELHETITLQANDQILLCSDGLYREFRKPKEIVDIVLGYSAEEATYQLIDLANSRGGKDNISVLIGQVHAQRSNQSVYPIRWESI